MSSEPYLIAKSEDGKHADVNLYGEVVQDTPIDFWTGEPMKGLYISLESFLKDLDSLSDMDSVTFHINSVGGDVFAGLSIYNRIRALKAETTTIVDGLAASAASIIAQAGDIRQVSLGAQTMIHGSSALLIGFYNEEDIQKVDGMLKSANKSLAGIYAERTGLEEEDVLDMMENETWMTPDEAVANGFADEVIGREEPIVDKIEGYDNMLMVNGIVHNFHNIPAPNMNVSAILTKDEIANGREPSVIDANDPKKEEKKMMTLEELKASQPDLVKQIQDEATTTACGNVNDSVQAALEADRNRMKEIDSIAKMVGDPQMVDKAKYEEPISASELALKAMKQQQAAGNTFMQARSEEMNETSDVAPAPNSGMNDSAAQLIVQNEVELEALKEKLKER